jgi:hypothetical protein
MFPGSLQGSDGVAALAPLCPKPFLPQPQDRAETEIDSASLLLLACTLR